MPLKVRTYGGIHHRKINLLDQNPWRPWEMLISHPPSVFPTARYRRHLRTTSWRRNLYTFLNQLDTHDLFFQESFQFLRKTKTPTNSRVRRPDNFNKRYIQQKLEGQSRLVKVIFS